MPPPNIHRSVLRRSCIIIVVAGVATFAVQPGCGEPFDVIACAGHRYTVVPTAGPNLPAIINPGLGQQEFFFSPPSIAIDDETHQAIVNGFDDAAEDRLRFRLADATRELCRRTLEDEVPGFDFRNDLNNCDSYTSESIAFNVTALEVGEPDPAGAHIQEPACTAACLLDDCTDYDTAGDYDPPPEHPFTLSVRCQCEIEEISDCDDFDDPDFVYAPDVSGFTEDYCLPDGESPSEYCRITIADYFSASIRALNHYVVIPAPPSTFDGTCGIYTPADLNVDVTCVPLDVFGDVATDAADAYTEQNDTCAPGCSNLTCEELQQAFPWDCSLLAPGPEPCLPESCHRFLDSACDCDLLPDECFENAVVPGVCLPDPVGGGADGGSDSGGGDPERLRSAITLLWGDWDRAAANYECSQIAPEGSPSEITGNPPPSGAVSPYALTNGTSFTSGLQHTCPAPTIDDVEISTFNLDLEELCRLIPLCDTSADLALTITAYASATSIASGTLAKVGGVITTSESGAPLSVGDHTIDLCVEHDPTGVEACSQQPIRASAPLGSGVDGFGYFAGEMAADFVQIAGKQGATQLSLSDDGYQKVELPSGFTFPFYGATASNYLWVGANGGVSVSSGPIAAANTSLPASASANAPEIAVYWDDLDPSSGGGVYTWFDGTRLIVSWEDVPHGRDGASSTSDGVSVQAHIYQSGYIEFHYLDTDVGDASYDRGKSSTIGIGNLTGTEAVEVSHDSSQLFASGAAALGLGLSSKGCLADDLIIPPEVACSAHDHYTTVCMPTGGTVQLPLVDASSCANGAVAVDGEVVESGTKETTLAALTTPISIDGSGNVDLDEGVHRVDWWPIDGQGAQVGPRFEQLVFVQTWVHAQCGGSSQLMLVLTEDDDSYVADPMASALAVVGLSGDDVIVTASGDDFIGDGSSDGICEAKGGDDVLVGEAGDDTLDGGVGDDRAWGGAGQDLVIGGVGADVLEGEEGDDILYGDAGADELWGGLGDDVLEGGDGADTLIPGPGVDSVYGGEGDDLIMLLDPCELTPGKYLSGGGGTDTLLLPPGLEFQDLATAGVSVDADIEVVATSTQLPTHRTKCDEI